MISTKKKIICNAVNIVLPGQVKTSRTSLAGMSLWKSIAL